MAEEITGNLISPAKLEANRENAKRSTGPRSLRGKRNSSKNATKYGLYAKDVVVTNGRGRENPREFLRLLDSVRKDRRPKGILEEWQVQRIAIAIWRSRRAFRAEVGAIENAFAEEGQLELSAVASDRSIPGGDVGTRILRYEAAQACQLKEALEALEKLQRRRAERDQVPSPEID